MASTLHPTTAARAGDLDLRTQAFIDGRFVAARSGRTFVTEDPATGRAIAEVAECDSADVDLAVAAARRQADGGEWSRMDPADRKRVLLRFADAIDAHVEELALIETLDTGKPISDTRSLDIPETANTIRWHAEAADKVYDQVAPAPKSAVAMIVHEPVGVVGAVVPWNYPAQMAAWKLGPALATGNAVVIKPATWTPLSLLRMGELAFEAGLPAGVLNVVPGGGSTVGEAIGRHMGIDMAAFTGSTEIGRRFLEYSAQSNIKRVALELGGKSPQVVMPDAAELPDMPVNATNAIFWNMGENCSAGSRLLVHRDVKERVLERLVEASRAWIVGDPMDEATRIGALISKSHMEKVLGYVEIGKREGARVVIGGRRVREESGGWFVEPTILDGVTNQMRVAQEEIFGPVLCVIEFSSEEEAIEIANDTDYGLGASIYTRDLETAHRMARAIKAGTVGVNAYSEGDLTTPFGGYKQSGFAGRDKSIHAHDEYLETKTIWIQMQG